jgi:hypothetical protein
MCGGHFASSESVVGWADVPPPKDSGGQGIPGTVLQCRGMTATVTRGRAQWPDKVPP